MAVGALLRKRRYVRDWRRQTEFTRRLRHQVVVEAGPDGRPGERLLAPSRPLHEPRIGEDGSREDFRVLIGRAGSSLSAVCLGAVAERGEPEVAALHTRDHLAGRWFECSPDVTVDRVAGEVAFRYAAALSSGRLTEWKFSHLGWLYVVGVLCVAPDRERKVVGRARASLATWRWLSAGDG